MDRKKTKAKIGPRLAAVLIGLMTYVLLFGLLIAAARPEQYDLRVGQVSPLTITATKDVEDTVTTQQLVDAAVAAVQPNYISDTTVMPKVLENLENAFAAMEAIRALQTENGALTDAQVTQALVSLAPVQTDRATVERIYNMTDDEFTAFKDELTALISGVMSSNLAEGQEEEAVSKLARDLSNAGLSEQDVEIARLLAAAYIEPNMFLDEEVTEANRQKAAESIEPVVYIKGRNIVKSGEIVTRAQIAMLDSLGLLKDKSIDVMMYLGIALLLLVLMASVAVYLRLFYKNVLSDPHTLTLLCTIYVLTACICLLCQKINAYLMPVCLGVMLTALLVDFRLSMVVNMSLALLTSQLAAGSSNIFTAAMFAVLMTSLVSGSLSLLVLHKKQQRLTVLLAGLIAGLGNVVTTFACGLINSADIRLVANYALWSGLSGVLASILCIGLQPALEWVFNLVTSAKLLELSNPNHPLIRRLILEASGTYHHSIIVANLAEAAADSIGANGLLARVGAYYHDVGKLKRPLYFKENQMGDNPHDRTDPLVSTAILTAHPRDGVALAQKERMPQAILDIIEQHHGDTPVIYFYDRARKLYGDENTNIEDFRYAGPKPQTAEAAIVMLADTVEAAARAMQEPTTEKMNALIHKLVRAKMDDGQLDECPLTMRDLEKICQAFMTVLNGAFHERVEYPNVSVTRIPTLPEVVSIPKEDAAQAPQPAEPAKPVQSQPASQAAQPEAKPAEPKEEK